MGVIEELRRRGVSDVENVKIRDEDMTFMPPRELVELRMAHAAGG